jgi:hypothetical protein
MVQSGAFFPAEVLFKSFGSTKNPAAPQPVSCLSDETG